MENMYIDFALYLLLLFLLVNFIVVSYVKNPTGSDQIVHLLLISLIKKNSHKFITKIEPFLFGYKNGYPQLFHWSLSFISDKSLRNVNKLSPIISNTLSLIIHLLFSFYIARQFNFNLQFVLYSTLLFLSSAILFNKQNARNIGISGRSAGLILGQLYMVLIFFYLINNTSLFLTLLVLLNLIIILTSQFTTQFVIFISLISSIIFFDVWLFLTLIVAFLLFYLFFPKIAVIYFSFQWEHKKYFVNYATKIFLLPNRQSIWGDFIIGFWKKLGINLKQGLLYVFNNPVIIVLSGVPIIIFILYTIIQNSLIQNHSNNIIYILIIINLCSVLIFILTSFKYTRFLGEPERYIDFAVMSFSVLGAILFYNNPVVIITAAAIGFIRILMENYIHKFVKGSNASHIKKIKDIIFSNDDVSKIRLLSNNLEITKKLLNTESVFFYGWLFYLSDIYNPDEIFLKHAIINPKYISTIIIDYSINYLIIDTKYCNKELTNEKLIFKELEMVENYRLFKVCSKN